MIDDFYTNPEIIEAQYRLGFAALADQDIDALAAASGGSGGGSTGGGGAAGGGGTTGGGGTGGGGFGGGWGGGCFLGNTPVRSASSIDRPIGKIQISDHVAAFDDQGRLRIAAVRYVHTFQVNEFLHVEFENGDVLCVTATHPFWQGSRKYTPIREAYIGRKLIFETDWIWLDVPIRKRTLVTCSEPITVFNLEVDTYHNFIAGGYGVHNRKDDPSTRMGDDPLII